MIARHDTPSRKDSRGASGRVEYTVGPHGLSIRSRDDVLSHARAWIKWNRERRSKGAYRARLDEGDRRMAELDAAIAVESYRRMKAELPDSEVILARTIAYHETGHAVAAESQGLRVDHIAIRVEHSGVVPGLGPSGPVRVGGGVCRVVDNRDAPTVDLAGMEAVRLAGLTLHDGWARGDVARVKKMGVDVDAVRQQASSLLASRWGSVEKIAAELERDGWLTGHRVRELLQ